MITSVRQEWRGGQKQVLQQLAKESDGLLLVVWISAFCIGSDAEWGERGSHVTQSLARDEVRKVGVLKKIETSFMVLIQLA